MTAIEESTFLKRLAEYPPLLIDAAMGSDLDRRGLSTSLPLWSAIGVISAPDLVRRIHVENLEAGADVVTTNTFRTSARTLQSAGLDPHRAQDLDALAVQLAREARAEARRPEAFVAGSIAPLEDCYRPTFDVSPETALEEHLTQAQNLAKAGVDFLMIETMPTSEEAAIALRAASATGLPATVGFVCGPLDGTGSPVRLLSGEALAEAVRLVEPLKPAAILVNCAAPAVISAALRELRDLTALPIGGYANVGEVDDSVGWSSSGGLSGAQYAEYAQDWLEVGARIIGGCCGTHPEHTRALRQLIDSEPSIVRRSRGKPAT